MKLTRSFLAEHGFLQHQTWRMAAMKQTSQAHHGPWAEQKVVRKALDACGAGERPCFLWLEEDAWPSRSSLGSGPMRHAGARPHLASADGPDALAQAIRELVLHEDGHGRAAARAHRYYPRIRQGVVKAAIETRMCPLGKEDHDALFGINMPLSSFSAKINLAFALVIIDEKTRRHFDGRGRSTAQHRAFQRAAGNRDRRGKARDAPPTPGIGDASAGSDAS